MRGQERPTAAGWAVGSAHASERLGSATSGISLRDESAEHDTIAKAENSLSQLGPIVGSYQPFLLPAAGAGTLMSSKRYSYWQVYAAAR